MKLPILAAALAIGLTAPAMAQDHSGHAGMAETSSAATEAYEAANAKMHMDMDVDYSGDADVDFIRNMLPHHQGAVDMAQIVLEYGSDPEIKALAEAIVAAQEQEIAFMKAWLAKRGL